MKCVNCGREIDDNSRFCPFCGTPVHTEDAASQQPAEETEVKTGETDTPVEETEPEETAEAPVEETQPEETKAEETETPAEEETEETKETETEETKSEEDSAEPGKPEEAGETETAGDTVQDAEFTAKSEDDAGTKEKPKKLKKPHVDKAGFKPFAALLKEPFRQIHLEPVPSVIVIAASVFVNAWFLYSMVVRFFVYIASKVYAGMGQRVVNLYGQVTAQLTNAGLSFGSEIGYGALLTAVVFAFLFLCNLNEKKDFKVMAGRAAGMMFMPVLFVTAAALCMHFSFAIGVVLGCAALVICVLEMDDVMRRTGKIGYVRIAVAAVFLLVIALLILKSDANVLVSMMF